MFSKTNKGADAAPAKATRRAGTFSVIGADVAINGNLVTGENLQVNGRIEGDVSCATFHQGASGMVSGNIVADEARLAGLVDGTVAARVLVLEPSARVTGDVSYEVLSIESGARVDGRFSHRPSGAEAGASPTHLFPPIAEAAE